LARVAKRLALIDNFVNDESLTLISNKKDVASAFYWTYDLIRNSIARYNIILSLYYILYIYIFLFIYDDRDYPRLHRLSLHD